MGVDMCKVGRRVLRSGQRVQIKGLRGLYKIQGFSDDGALVTVYGAAPRRAPLMRVLPVARIGRRPVAVNKEAGQL